MHYFPINSIDDVFITHMYVVEEFESVNSALITHTQAKTDFEINNFNFLSKCSQLTLFTCLKSGGVFEEDHIPKDKKKGDISHEEGVMTAQKVYLGYFSWAKNVIIDGVSKRVLSSPFTDDENDLNGQNIYLNYLWGIIYIS